MSAEHISQNYPPDPEFINSIKGEAEQKRQNPLVCLANKFADLGREALLEKERIWEDEELDSWEFEEKSIDELETIFFGHLVTELYESIEARTFNLESLVDKYNFSITGTQADKLELPSEYNQLIILDDEDYSFIKDSYTEDQTLTSLLEQVAGLPKELGEFINECGALRYGPNFYEILTIWEKASHLLIDKELDEEITYPFTWSEAESYNPYKYYEEFANNPDLQILREKFQNGEIES